MSIINFEVYVSIISGVILGLSFIIGAAIAIRFELSLRIKANVIAFAAGIFFSTVAFSLIDESVRESSVLMMIIGLSTGSVIFSMAYHFLNKPEDDFWPKHYYKDINFESESGESMGDIEKESEKEETIFTKLKGNEDDEVPEYTEDKGVKNRDASKIIIIGTLLDSIPEGLFIGILIALEHNTIIGALIALFLGNLSTAIEGAERMIEQRNTFRKIVLRWLVVFSIVTVTTPIGYFLVPFLTNEEISIILGFAAGALMAFITEELIPTAFKKNKYHIGLSTTFGFIVGYVLFHFL
ncbi:MAG: ZIP family metal transporter [Candidatus Nitrosocosmicus sp.]